MNEFKVTIEQFEGPLDLMLHLIKEKELDLFDLDVNVLTDQYISYLNAMSEMHLEVASEYLVELAELIEYKSKKLLPRDNSELEDDYEEDPKERLVRRLLEYQQFKEISQTLNMMYEERQEMLTKPMSGVVDEWIRSEPEDQHYTGETTRAYSAGPAYDPEKLEMNAVTIVVQVNGKVRTKFDIRKDEDKAVVEETALAQEALKPFLEGKTVRKVIVVPNKIVNIVAN